jgi:imidazoleglycerol-phosphate dehydratase
MMDRKVTVNRKTAETEIAASLCLDGTGEARLDLGIGFMTHMLNTFARHGLFDLDITARGDLEVDQHHLVEDLGITLGQCFYAALGDKRGIRRAASCLFPMDECLARASVDISGRGCLVFDGQLSNIPLVSGSHSFQTDLVEDFWQGFVSEARLTLHLEILRGRSDHHKIEALFKAAARALREACEIDSRARGTIPSTKGTLSEMGAALKALESPGVFA